jgi:hypothetical protein
MIPFDMDMVAFSWATLRVTVTHNSRRLLCNFNQCERVRRKL